MEVFWKRNLTVQGLARGGRSNRFSFSNAAGWNFCFILKQKEGIGPQTLTDQGRRRIARSFPFQNETGLGAAVQRGDMPRQALLPEASYLLRENRPFKIRSSQGAPCSTKSNQSRGRTRRPRNNICNFSTIWGGLKGARPMVRQAMSSSPQGNDAKNFSIVAIFFFSCKPIINLAADPNWYLLQILRTCLAWDTALLKNHNAFP